MWNPFLLLILTFCTAAGVNAQQNKITFVQAQPKDGTRALALAYHSIGFTDAQREGFVSGDIELIFEVDTLGNAILHEVRGVIDKSIIDSLKHRKAPEFVPATLNGIAQHSQQSFLLSFPNSKRRYNTICHGMFDVSQLSHLQTSRRIEFAVGGFMNVHTGNASKYVRPGGGYRIEGVYKPTFKTGFGFAMGMYGNRFRNPYPVEPFMSLRITPVSIFFTALVTEPVFQKGKHEVHFQAELSYVGQNIARTTENNSNAANLDGYAPGLLIRYSIQKGNERLHYVVGNPSTQVNRIEFHAAVRRVIMNLKEASSTTVEAGISYRLVGKEVKYFRLK